MQGANWNSLFANVPSHPTKPLKCPKHQRGDLGLGKKYGHRIISLLMEGFFHLTPIAVSFRLSLVSGAARAFQGQAAWGSRPYLSTRCCVGQLKNLSSCRCYSWSPGISSKWIWPLAKQPVHTSLIRVFLLDEKKKGVDVEEEQLSLPLPKQNECPAAHCTPGWAHGFKGKHLVHCPVGEQVYAPRVCPTSSDC